VWCSPEDQSAHRLLPWLGWNSFQVQGAWIIVCPPHLFVVVDVIRRRATHPQARLTIYLTVFKAFS